MPHVLLFGEKVRRLQGTKNDMTLTKSDYMTFLKHPAWLWLKKFEKHRLPEIDESPQAIFEAGYEFESYAEKLFPDGIRLGFNSFPEYNSLTARTQEALNNGVKTILQGRFETKDLTCIVDVLDRVEENKFDLIEIKSSTRAKPEHYYDLAFQVKVLEESGLTIQNISVIHINKEYKRKGDIDPQQITAITDVTDEVRALAEFTNEQVTKAQEVFTLTQMPDPSPRWANHTGVPGTSWFHEWLDMYKYLHPELDRYSIYSLSYPNAKQIGELEDAGIILIKDIPDDNGYKDKHQLQVTVTKTNKRIIDTEKIKDFLGTFQYPLYFLDYETYSSLVPIFDNESPYCDYPFQYSLHILDVPDADVRHVEYLHEANTCAIPDLVKQLQTDIGDTGTILSWNMSYEKGCNDRMAKLYPDYADFLLSVNERIVDLDIPFKDLWFVDKDFFGSYSIKYVLPVLVPELSYKELEVSDGLKARRLWMDTYLKGDNQDKKDQIYQELCEYCTLDTYAMVKIFKELENVVKQK